MKGSTPTTTARCNTIDAQEAARRACDGVDVAAFRVRDSESFAGGVHAVDALVVNVAVDFKFQG